MDSNLSVLYIEDDAQSRRVMSMLLQGRMKLSNVTIYEDSHNFMERVEALQPKPDIVFLDIHLQPYNGFEMLEMLRTLDWGARVPIIALTASVMNEEIHQLRMVGFDGCLSKPINMATFPDLLEQILAGESIWRIIN